MLIRFTEVDSANNVLYVDDVVFEFDEKTEVVEEAAHVLRDTLAAYLHSDFVRNQRPEPLPRVSPPVLEGVEVVVKVTYVSGHAVKVHEVVLWVLHRLEVLTGQRLVR